MKQHLKQTEPFQNPSNLVKTHTTNKQAMAIQNQPKIHKLPQPNYIDSLLFLHTQSPFHKTLLISSFNTQTQTPLLQTLTFNQTLSPISSWTPPSRISTLKASPTLAAAATKLALHIFPSSQRLKPVGVSVGGIGDVDIMGSACVCVGEDGRVNLVDCGSGGMKARRVFDGNGLVSYNAVKWASGNEFVVGGFGFGLQWWDLRRPESVVANFKGSWDKGASSGIIHSVDINTSRKHTCLAGGSSGTVFVWDLRWPQNPIFLSVSGANDTVAQSLSESEVWQVKFDCYQKSSNINSSSQILPAMFCSEDGILAVIEQGEEPTELLAEPCAINSFDIDSQNPSDVVCSLEWESIVLLSRP